MDRTDPEASCTELDDKQQQKQQQQLHQDEVEFISEQNSVEDKMSSTSSEYVLTADTDDLSKAIAGIQSPRRVTKASIKSPATFGTVESDSSDADDDKQFAGNNITRTDRNEQQRLLKENGGASIKSKKRLLSNDNSTDHINGSENEEEEDFAGFGEADINEDKGNNLRTN